MRINLKIVAAVIIAGFLAFIGLYGIGAAGRKSGNNDTSWSSQAEKSFYLSPGMGEKVLSKNQWHMFQKEMEGMTPEELSSFRLGMHKILMEDIHAEHMDKPHKSPYDKNQQDVKLNTDDDSVITLVAGTTAGAKAASGIVGGSISPGAATGLSGGSTPVTGTSGTAGGATGFGDNTSSVTGTSGTVSGSTGGTAALSSFNPVADFSTSSQSITAVAPTAQQTHTAATTALLAASGSAGTSASQAPSLTAVPAGGAPVITITPNESDISPRVTAMGLAGREPVYDVCIQGGAAINQYAPVPAAATSLPSRSSVSYGIITSNDTERMFGSNPTTSTTRSVGTYDDSRGAIFHKDFDIGGGNRDLDRNNW